MDQVRIGIIGSGGFARYHLSNFRNVSEAKIVAICEPSSVQVAATHRDYPELVSAPTYSNHTEMIAAGGLDAVLISSPHTLHTQQILDAFSAGLHVLCDKPMVTSVVDAKRVIAARDASGKVGMVSYQRHNEPAYRLIRQRIQSGEVGAVQMISAFLSQEWKRLTKGSWRQDPALSGGGQLNDSGSHMVDILLWVTSLKAEAVSCLADFRETAVDINSTVLVQFAGGAQGSIVIAGDAHQWHEDITVVCDRATFKLRGGVLSVVEEDGTVHNYSHISGGGNPETNFVGAILRGEEIQAPFECGLRVIELTEAAWRSAEQNGQRVAVSSLG